MGGGRRLPIGGGGGKFCLGGCESKESSCITLIVSRRAVAEGSASASLMAWKTRIYCITILAVSAFSKSFLDTPILASCSANCGGILVNLPVAGSKLIEFYFFTDKIFVSS